MSFKADEFTFDLIQELLPKVGNIKMTQVLSKQILIFDVYKFIPATTTHSQLATHSVKSNLSIKIDFHIY